MKIRTDCKQSVRISGTTPSGCACAHSLEESSTEWRKELKEKAERNRSVPHDFGRVAGDPGSWLGRSLSTCYTPSSWAHERSQETDTKRQAPFRRGRYESTRPGTAPRSASAA